MPARKNQVSYPGRTAKAVTPQDEEFRRGAPGEPAGREFRMLWRAVNSNEFRSSFVTVHGRRNPELYPVSHIGLDEFRAFYVSAPVDPASDQVFRTPLHAKGRQYIVQRIISGAA